MRHTLRPLSRALVMAVIFMPAGPAWAQTAAPAQPAPAAAEATTYQGSMWPSLLFHDLFGGPSGDLTHYMERYGVRTGFGDDRRQSFLADLKGLSFVSHDGRRDVFTIERQVWARYNQRGAARFDSKHVRVSGGYGFYRQAANGLDYLFAPSRIEGGLDPAYTGGNVGYLGKYNDSVTDALFATTRATYNVALEIKPAALRDKASAKAAFRGIDRSGSIYETTVLGGGDVLGTNADRRAKLRWHGYESTVDESANELSFSAALRPIKQVNVEYELGYERFRNQATTLTMGDLAATSGIRLVSTTAEGGAEGGINSAAAANPLHFVPDANMIRQSLLASAGNDKVLVSTGAGWNLLTQETFTANQLAAGYRQGEIASQQLFLTVAARPSSSVRMEGYARRSETNRRMDRYDTNLRLNAFTLWTYGVEAEVRPGQDRVVLTPGWTRRTAERDIEFGSVPAQRSLIRADSASDEVFVRARWKMSPRVSLRVTPSVLWSDKTGYVTEPTRANKVSLALAYANTLGTRSATAFYTIRSRRNDSLSLVGNNGVAVTQDARGSLQQVGVAGSMAPRDSTNLYASYAWSRDEFNADLFSASARRYDATPVFVSRGDRQTYLLGSHTITAGADITPSSKMNCVVSYTATRTSGDTASGRVRSVLPAADGRIDSWYHSAGVRVERDIHAAFKLGISYMLDYYSDGSFADLTGGLNTLTIGIGYRF